MALNRIEENMLGQSVKDRFENVESQLAENSSQLSSSEYNIKFPFPTYLPKAIGDGVTDDTASIQTAIDYCIANKMTLRVPKGDFLITGLTAVGKLVIKGAHRDFSTFLYNGSGTALKLNNNDVANPDNSLTIFGTNLRDFGIKNNGTGTIGLEITRTAYSYFENLRIDGFQTNVYIHGWLNDPTAYRGVYNNVYKKISALNCETGFMVQGIISDSYFEECVIEYPTNYGFYFKNPSDQIIWGVSIQKCTVIGTLSGSGVKKCVFLENTAIRNWTIEGCNFENYTEHGLLSNSLGTNVGYGSTIKDNVFLVKTGSVTAIGIDADYIYNYEVSQNNFFGTTAQDINFRANALNSFIINNVGINKTIVVLIASTTNSYQYNDYQVNQRVLRFNKGIYCDVGDLVLKEASKGVVLTTPDGTKQYRIVVGNTGIVSTILIS